MEVDVEAASSQVIYFNYFLFQGIIEDDKIRLTYEIKSEKGYGRNNYTGKM